MENNQFFIYLLLLSGSTYLIRVIPFITIRKKIKNKFIKSFLYYIPYAVLTAMTVPAVFYATNHVLSAVVGMTLAVIFALKDKSLTTVAVIACAGAFVAELFM